MRTFAKIKPSRKAYANFRKNKILAKISEFRVCILVVASDLTLSLAGSAIAQREAPLALAI